MEKAEEILLAEFVLPIIKDIVLPKIKSIVKGKASPEINESEIVYSFENYFLKKYEKYLVIDTLVFPNRQTQLKLLYQPLLLESLHPQESSVQITVDQYPIEFLPKYIRAVIIDTAGMGKSTIAKKLFLSIIEQKAGIPVLIELRQINSEHSILQEIQSQLSHFDCKITIEAIENLLTKGEFIFLLDGYDEISRADMDFVNLDLRRFIEKANDNYFLITSRDDNSLTSLGDFYRFSIKSLSIDEAFSLLKKYDIYNYEPIADSIIKKITCDEDTSVHEFLSNPFLISLLYKSYDFKKDIPQKKSQFYGQVYDALFEDHDFSKSGYFRRPKFTNLHKDEFEMVLRYISFFTSKENKISYDKDYIIEKIRQAKRFLTQLNFKESDYLEDLYKTVPLFRRESNEYKWAHKSLQDYFTAKYIMSDANEKQKDILRKIYADPTNLKYMNILELFCEMDQSTFETTVLLWYLEDFESFSKSTFKGFTIDEASVEWRKQILFESEFLAFYATKNMKLNYDNYRSLIDKEILAELGTMSFERVLIQGYRDYKIIFFEKPIIKHRALKQIIKKRIPNLISKSPEPINFNVLNLAYEKLYIVNDDRENILNSKNNFWNITWLLNNRDTINYRFAFSILKRIRERIKDKDSTDILDWN